jgi:hypothetical protein
MGHVILWVGYICEVKIKVMKNILKNLSNSQPVICKKYQYVLQNSTHFINKHVYETIIDIELRVNTFIIRNQFKLELEIF